MINKTKERAVVAAQDALDAEGVRLPQAVVNRVTEAVLGAVKAQHGTRVANQLRTVMVPGRGYTAKELAVMTGAHYVVVNQAVRVLVDSGEASASANGSVGAGRVITLL